MICSETDGNNMERENIFLKKKKKKEIWNPRGIFHCLKIVDTEGSLHPHSLPHTLDALSLSCCCSLGIDDGHFDRTSRSAFSRWRRWTTPQSLWRSCIVGVVFSFFLFFLSLLWSIPDFGHCWCSWSRSISRSRFLSVFCCFLWAIHNGIVFVAEDFEDLPKIYFLLEFLSFKMTRSLEVLVFCGILNVMEFSG